MEASLPGFKTAVVESVLLDVNASLKIDLTLEVGRAEELVNVIAHAPLLQAERTNLGQTVTEQQIEQLPTGRALFSLIPLAAGVSQQVACDGDCGNNANLRINGDRPRTQDYILDGTTINAPVFGGQSINPSIDVIQEFRIESNSMSAEYGRAGGGLLIARDEERHESAPWLRVRVPPQRKAERPRLLRRPHPAEDSLRSE